jgi:hypothetical protein
VCGKNDIWRRLQRSKGSGKYCNGNINIGKASPSTVSGRKTNKEGVLLERSAVLKFTGQDSKNSGDLW